MLPAKCLNLQSQLGSVHQSSWNWSETELACHSLATPKFPDMQYTLIKMLLNYLSHFGYQSTLGHIICISNVLARFREEISKENRI